MEAVALTAVPDVPDERPVVKQFAVFLEEAVAEPVVQVNPAGQFARLRRLDARRSQQRQQPFRRGLFAAYRRDARNAIVIRQLFQTIRAERRAIGKT